MREDRWISWVVAAGAAVAAGALLVVGVLGATGHWSDRPAGPTAALPPVPVVASGPPASAPSTAGARLVRQPAAGDCIDLVTSAAVPGALIAVPCDQAHDVEIAATVDPADVFTLEPSAEQWKALLVARCPRLVEAYLGSAIDPYGRFALRISAPSAEDWAADDRLGECALAPLGGMNGTARLTGRATAGGQLPDWPAGQCLTSSPTTPVPTPTSCDQPHDREVTGRLELGAATDRYPDEDAWTRHIAACMASAEAHAGRPLVLTGQPTLVATALRPPVESWLAGRRSTFCTVAELDAAGVVTTRTGSLAG